MKTVNGYDVVITKGTPRFRLDKKLIKRDSVPFEVQQELLADAMNKDAVRTVEAAPDPASQIQPGDAPVPAVPAQEYPTTEPDPNPYIEAGAPEVFPPQPPVDNAFVAEGAELFTTPEPTPADEPKFSELELELLEENDQLKRKLAVANEEPTRPVLAGAKPEELGNILLAQYGVYTALAPRDAQIGDIHPLTLRQMNRYDVGLAYAERKKSVGQVVDVYQPVAPVQANAPDNGGFPTFATRTGVSFGSQTSATLQHHNNDPISDEATAEPNLRGTTIRPYW